MLVTGDLEDTPDAVALHCVSCGSGKVRRSRTRGVRERVLKWTTDFRAFKCGDCGERQLSALRPARRARGATPLRPNPLPDDEPAPSPAPSPDPAPAPHPLPDPWPEGTPRQRRRDPLAEKIELRRRRRMLVTAVLVLLTGAGVAMLVVRTSGAQVQATE